MIVESNLCEGADLALRLRRQGHRVAIAETGAQALRMHHAADLVLLDLELPDLDGLEVCRKIRAQAPVPVIAVTSRNSELDCVLGLQAGADDYLVKPYGFRELLARMEAVMRRARPYEARTRCIVRGPLRVDEASRQVTLDGRRVEVTRKEFDLLHLLASRPDMVVPREQLVCQVWGQTWSRRTVDTHVSSLRGKLGSSAWIVTVRGIGFRLGQA